MAGHIVEAQFLLPQVAHQDFGLQQPAVQFFAGSGRAGIEAVHLPGEVLLHGEQRLGQCIKDIGADIALGRFGSGESPREGLQLRVEGVVSAVDVFEQEEGRGGCARRIEQCRIGLAAVAIDVGQQRIGEIDKQDFVAGLAGQAFHVRTVIGEQKRTGRHADVLPVAGVAEGIGDAVFQRHRRLEFHVAHHIFRVEEAVRLVCGFAAGVLRGVPVDYFAHAGSTFFPASNMAGTGMEEGVFGGVFSLKRTKEGDFNPTPGPSPERRGDAANTAFRSATGLYVSPPSGGGVGVGLSHTIELLSD